MEKNENGIYRINLMLPPGFHQYKFKIDNIWAYSQKQPKFEDNNGNVNNPEGASKPSSSSLSPSECNWQQNPCGTETRLFQVQGTC